MAFNALGQYVFQRRLLACRQRLVRYKDQPQQPLAQLVHHHGAERQRVIARAAVGIAGLVNHHRGHAADRRSVLQFAILHAGHQHHQRVDSAGKQSCSVRPCRSTADQDKRPWDRPSTFRSGCPGSPSGPRWCPAAVRRRVHAIAGSVRPALPSSYSILILMVPAGMPIISSSRERIFSTISASLRRLQFGNVEVHAAAGVLERVVIVERPQQWHHDRGRRGQTIHCDVVIR